MDLIIIRIQYPPNHLLFTLSKFSFIAVRLSHSLIEPPGHQLRAIVPHYYLSIVGSRSESVCPVESNS